MNRDKLYEIMDQGNLGYACVYKSGNDGNHTDYMFSMTAENIANFIGKNAFEADRIILTDLCDQLICESIYGGILLNCPDQNLCREINSFLVPIQIGEAEPKEFAVATRDAMEELWHEEEMEVMRAEISML